MSYTIDRTLTDADFDAVDERLRAALAERGFGVLTEVDVKATMKKKLDADLEPCRISRRLQPQYGAEGDRHRAAGRGDAALQCHSTAGRRRRRGSAVDPVASMQAIDNDDLAALAAEVRDMLAEAVQAA